MIEASFQTTEYSFWPCASWTAKTGWHKLAGFGSASGTRKPEPGDVFSMNRGRISLEYCFGRARKGSPDDRMTWNEVPTVPEVAMTNARRCKFSNSNLAFRYPCSLDGQHQSEHYHSTDSALHHGPQISCLRMVLGNDPPYFSLGVPSRLDGKAGFNRQDHTRPSSYNVYRVAEYL